MKKLRGLTLFLLMLTLILSGCAPKGEVNQKKTADSEGVAQLTMRTPPSLDPVSAPWESDKNTFLLIYDGLFYESDTFEACPRLAESYSVLSEGLEVMIHLRRDVSWHDGKPFTAADVIATFDRIRGTENAAFAENIRSVASWTKVDDYTVDLFLTEPCGTVVHQLTFPILPAHITDFSATTVGTGPFKVAEYNPKSNLRLVPNEKYFEGAPRLKGVTVRFVRTDDMDAAAFCARSSDLISAAVQETAPFSQKPKMKDVEKADSTLIYVGMNTGKRMFSSPHTRRAIGMLLNRSEILAQDYQGKGVAAQSTIHPAYPYFDSSYNLNYSLDEARESLFHAGWSDLSGDGIIDLPSGGEESVEMGTLTSFVCTILVNEEDLARQSIAKRLEGDLKAVGIGASVEKVSYESYMDRLESGDFDLYIGKVRLPGTLDADLLVGSGGSVNYSSYVSDSLDSVLSAMINARDDLSEKLSCADYQKAFSEEYPIAPILYLNRGYYVWDRLDLCSDGFQNPYAAAYLWQCKGENG